jgi:hypothetical protein
MNLSPTESGEPCLLPPVSVNARQHLRRWWRCLALCFAIVIPPGPFPSLDTSEKLYAYRRANPIGVRCEYVGVSILTVRGRHKHIDPTPSPKTLFLLLPRAASQLLPSVCYSTTPLTFRAMSELRLLLLRLGRALSGGRGTCLTAVHAVSSAS